MKLAVIGGGWAGLAAAVRAAGHGHHVTLFELAGQLGGRARSVQTPRGSFDNGQHILIGAYLDTLNLMRTVGVEPESVLLRTPLRLRHADGSGLAMRSGAAIPAFTRAVLGYRGWSWKERFALLAAAAGWSARGFRCAPELTVAQLTERLPVDVRRSFIDPLCVAALNTPAPQASASVFLRVLRDALFAGPGASDLLIPRAGLDALLPEPAARWLKERGARVRLGRRVGTIAQAASARETAWRVDDELFDAVVLACTAQEAARLAAPIRTEWAARAGALRYEPIVTVYLSAPDVRLPEAMVALREDEDHPAQFAFDHERLSGRPGLVAAVASGASLWTNRGLDATGEAARRQLAGLLSGRGAAKDRLGSRSRQDSADEQPEADVQVLQVVAEKRATFLCTPGLQRPALMVAPGLFAAGDYVDGPYPATLEGAVQSGLAAAAAAMEA